MRVKGSMTVFSALAFMLVASFLFALLEAARLQSLAVLAEQKSMLCLEAVCTEYQPVLWEEYRLLGLDAAYGSGEFSMEQVSGRLSERINRNLEGSGDGANILAMELGDVEPVSYQLLTDGDGAVFLECVAGYMEGHLPQEAAKKLCEKYQENIAMEAEAPGEDRVQNAQNALNEARKAAEEAEREARENARKESEAKGTAGAAEDTGNAEIPAEGETKTEIENPIELVLMLKQNALLSMVTDAESLSDREVSTEGSLERRECMRGTAAAAENPEWYQKILVTEYLDAYFSDYTNPSEEHALAYEMEYVLGGAASDRENLEKAVGKLLLVREAANVAHILSDIKKMEAVKGMAAALAGFTGNPAVIKVVEIGIVAAWAYMESVLDVRALLQGDRIALIKSGQQWTTTLGNLLAAFESGNRAADCPGGLSYQDYLKAFVYAMGQRRLAYRMMDIMEQNVRYLQKQDNFRMDYVIGRMGYEVTYQTEPLFCRLSVLGDGGLMTMTVKNTTRFSYY